MPISIRKGILAITLALTIVISSSVFPNTNNSNHFIVKALSKKYFSYLSSSTSSHNNDGFFYKTVDGHRNRCYNEYKSTSTVCTKEDGTSNGNSSTTSSLGSSTYYLHNYSRIIPSNIDESWAGKNSDSDNSNHNSDSNIKNLQTSDNQDKQSKLQQKIEKLQSRIDKLREESRTQELEYYGSRSSSHPSSPLPPPASTATTNNTLDNSTNNNSTLQSVTTPPPAALSSSPASSHEVAYPIFTQDNTTNKSSITNWIFNDDNSNRNNYTYSSGLASSPLILPGGNTHTNSTNLSTHSSGGNVNSFYGSPSRQINTKDIADNAITTPKIANNAITEAKLSRDAVHVVWPDDTISGNSEILYRTNAGDVFGRNADDLSNSAGFSEKPAIFVSGNDVYVVWDDDTSGNAEILYRKSTDGGASFGSTVNLSNDAGTSRAPALVVFGNNIYVVWSDDTVGNFEIYYRKSTDGGASFGSTVNLSSNGADSGSGCRYIW